jgi:hypothetical protein
MDHRTLLLESPLHVGHDIVEESVGFPGIVDREDMGVGESRRYLDLP